jgi:hypothetical protein
MSYLSTSDQRLKENITSGCDYITRLMDLGDVVDYYYTAEARQIRRRVDSQRHTGIIYQNALKAGITNLCSLGEDGYGSVNHLTPDLMFTAIGALQQTIKRQLTIEDKIKELEDEIQQLKKQL